MTKKYNYVIARRWDESDDHLAVYTYFKEVNYGTKEQAEEYADSISKKTGRQYKPYYIEMPNNLTEKQKEFLDAYDNNCELKDLVDEDGNMIEENFQKARRFNDALEALVQEMKEKNE